MSKRFNTPERTKLISNLATSCAPLCLYCLLAFDPTVPALQVTIDHVNNKPADRRMVNLILLHRGCNTIERNNRRGGGRLITPQNVQQFRNRAIETWLSLNKDGAKSTTPSVQVTLKREKEREREVAGEGYSSEPLSALAVNRDKHPRYLSWLLQQVQADGWISTNDAVIGGAQVIGIGQATASKYFELVTHRFGWLKKGNNLEGESGWVFREGNSLRDILKKQSSEVMEGTA